MDHDSRRQARQKPDIHGWPARQSLNEELLADVAGASGKRSMHRFTCFVFLV
jgi:hypothetical protein